MLGKITIEKKGKGWNDESFSFEDYNSWALFSLIDSYSKKRATHIMRGSISDIEVQQMFVELHDKIVDTLITTTREDEFCNKSIKALLVEENFTSEVRKMVAFCISNPFLQDSITFKWENNSLNFVFNHASSEVENKWTQLFISSYNESHYDSSDRVGADYFHDKSFKTKVNELCFKWDNYPSIWGSCHEGSFSVYINPIYTEKQVLSFVEELNNMLPSSEQLSEDKTLEFLGEN